LAEDSISPTATIVTKAATNRFMAKALLWELPNAEPLW